MILWNKTSYQVKLHGGVGRIATEPMHGLIQHLIVIPSSKNTVWSMRILDQEEDVIYEVIDHEGRLDDKDGLPVGKDMQQKVDIIFYDSTSNEKMRIILKVKET